MSEFNFSLLDKIQVPKTIQKPDIDSANKLAESQNGQTGKSFMETLQGMFQEVNAAQVNADTTTQKFVAGEPIQLHEVMMAVEKADIAIRTATAFRNKIVEAYQEIMRMPV
jgi:flagellar hook-basal body complex protein FliE